ncbi:hypothetical protein SAMN05216275_102158 [Streptosporangium canum]|uniref:Uncharacterized protein n=1 Tax=Streptosporangium canum TaxID=324952 RepID=A0A1I3GP56_9ACTN|nr:hypothetical protein [Streptosporangium canum]SFI25129.1 hypothetical protein SAMN05216275_102158 [Streptosporangium canum]
MTIDSSNPNEQNYKPLAFILVLFSSILMVMPIDVVIKVSESVRHPVTPVFIPALILVGLPTLGALVGAFLRFQGPGGRLFGVILGIFIASVILMALLVCWLFYSVD